MKNVFYLFLILLVLGCGSDDENSEEGPINVPPDYPFEKSTLLTLNVGDIFYETGTFSFTGHVFLTDEDGKLLKDTNLLSNNNYELNAFYDYKNKPYDLTIAYAYKYFGVLDGAFYYIRTFKDIEPMTVNLSLDDPNPEDVWSQIEIQNIGDAGFELDSLTTEVYRTLSCSEANGGSCNLKIKLETIPDNIFASFKKPSEDTRRYVLLEGVYGEETNSFEYSNLPLVTDVTTIDYPAGSDYLRSNISCYFSNNPSRFHTVSDHLSYDGATQFNHHYPKDVFDGYRLLENYKTADVGYFSRKVSQTVETKYAFPDLDFQINNNSLDNYDVDVFSDYDYSLALFSYPENIAPITYTTFLNWYVYGPPEKDIQFSMSGVSDIVFEKVLRPEHIDFITLESIFPTFSRIYNINGALSYKDIAKSYIEKDSLPSLGVDLLEYVEKR